jgi:hypothetical protein
VPLDRSSHLLSPTRVQNLISWDSPILCHGRAELCALNPCSRTPVRRRWPRPRQGLADAPWIHCPADTPSLLYGGSRPRPRRRHHPWQARSHDAARPHRVLNRLLSVHRPMAMGRRLAIRVRHGCSRPSRPHQSRHHPYRCHHPCGRLRLRRRPHLCHRGPRLPQRADLRPCLKRRGCPRLCVKLRA